MEVHIKIPQEIVSLVDNGEVIALHILSKDTMMNVTNMVLDFVDNPEELKTQKVIKASIGEDKRERFLAEFNELTNRHVNLGRLGYVLGLHSAVFALTDRSGERQKTMHGYSAGVMGKNIYTKAYMYATLSPSVIDEHESPFYVEDYIFLRQLELHGDAKAQNKIPADAFRELFNSMVEFMKLPTIFFVTSSRKDFARRYTGIVLGMLVRYGFKSSISTMHAVATSMALEDELPSNLYKSFLDAYEFAKQLGDVR